MNRFRHRRFAISPRLVVLGTLLCAYAWVLAFPLQLTRPPSAALATAYVAGLALLGGALALVLRAAVTPEQSPPARLRLIGLLVVVTVGLWLPAFAWAEPREEPWAWLA